MLVPFEMAIQLGGAQSVMPTYVETDGVPASSDEYLLSTLLRGELGFDGLVVSDYFAVSFLELQHAVAASPAAAARLALAAGLDVELPNSRCFGTPLLAAVRAGDVPVELVDRAVGRVLRQKIDLGLLDPGWVPVPSASAPDLDPPAQRAIARRLAEESVILVANDGGALPLARPAKALPPKTLPPKIAVVGPLGDDQLAFFGCYSMPRHLGHLARGGTDGPGVAVATLLAALREELPDVTYLPRLRRHRRRQVRDRRGRGRRPRGRRGHRGSGRRSRPVRARHLRRGVRRH
jgi:beta-xylosidase